MPTAPDDGSVFNRFKTFTQELRLQGEAFDGRLDWLVGGYYANEKLRVDDTVAYGDDFQRYANCLVVGNFAAVGPGSILAPTRDRRTASIRRSSPVRFADRAGSRSLTRRSRGCRQLPQPLPPAQITALAAFAGLNNTPCSRSQASASVSSAVWISGSRNLALPFGLPGSTPFNGVMLHDTYNQSSNNWALFTHNIFDITDQLTLTVGARYTHEKKKLDGRPRRQ